MMILPNGSTDVTSYFVLRDSTTHAPKTDITITDIDLYYVEELAAISAKVDATALDAANSAHSDSKAYHVGQGLYRIDWPDAAFDGGVGKKVNLIAVCSGVDTTFLEVQLSPHVTLAAAQGSYAPAKVGDKMDIADAPSATGLAAMADAFLTRAFTSVSYTGTVRCALTALQAVRNKFTSAAGAAGYVVKKEDDSTASWTGTLTVDGDGNITGMDPD